MDPSIDPGRRWFADGSGAERAAQTLPRTPWAPKRIGVIDDPRRSREVFGTRARQFVVPMTLIGAVVGVVLLLLVPGADPYQTSPSAPILWLLIGATAGLPCGALLGKLTPRGDARLYERQVERGAVLVTVHCAPGERGRIRGILAGAGARDVETEGTAESP